MKTQFKYEEPELKQFTLMTLVHASDKSCMFSDVIEGEDGCTDAVTDIQDGSL